MATQKKLTDPAAKRTARFNALFSRLPGPTAADRIRQTAAILHCSETTVRIYRVTNTARPIPASSLSILSEALHRAEARATVSK